MPAEPLNERRPVGGGCLGTHGLSQLNRDTFTLDTFGLFSSFAFGFGLRFLLRTNDGLAFCLSVGNPFPFGFKFHALLV
jgi:hypothetical protein